MKKNIKKKLCVGPLGAPTTHPDNAGLAVRGPTHTDQIGPIRCPKWVGPLEMPLGIGWLGPPMPTLNFSWSQFNKSKP
jgi:hypothetical protein